MEIKNNLKNNENLRQKYITSKFAGKNIVSDSAKILNSDLENCEIGKNVEIFNAILKDCKIEDNSKIGTFQKLEVLQSEPKQDKKTKYFGTDGIRGIFEQDLNIELIKKVAKSLCFNAKTKIVLGKDTRESGQEIANIFIEELKKYGAKVFDLGIISTPAVSFFTVQKKATYGVVITASHNPKEYNGIKILGKNGEKLDENEELKLEKLFEQELAESEIKGKVEKLKKDTYINFIENIDGNKFDEIKIVLDCANGAVSEYASKIFENLHANVIAINTSGNINEKCGALYPEVLAKVVKQSKAHLGFSFDGDADRVIAVNSAGQIIDGDEILYLLAWYYKSLNLLNSNNVVGTILTNMGIENKLKALNINLIRAQVGDKYIIEIMEKNNYELGGEQSGHIINKKFLTSGDGLLTARILTNVFLENKHIFFTVKENKYVQVYKNIILNNKINNLFFNSAEFKTLINFYQAKLKNNGRIIIRPSGTEPKIRIMVETTDKTTANIFAIDIKKKLTNLLKIYTIQY